MSTHDIRVQAWGHDPVLVCRTCNHQTDQGNTVSAVLLRTVAIEGLAYGDIVAAIEAHTGEGAHRAIIGGEQVEGQVEFGVEAEIPPLVAYGEPDDYRAPGVSRMGQVLPPDTVSRRRSDGGPSVREYLQSRGEL